MSYTIRADGRRYRVGTAQRVTPSHRYHVRGGPRGEVSAVRADQADEDHRTAWTLLYTVTVPRRHHRPDTPGRLVAAALDHYTHEGATHDWIEVPPDTPAAIYRAEMVEELAAVLDQAEDGARIIRGEMGADATTLAETLDRPPVPSESEEPAPWYVTLTDDQRAAVLHRIRYGTGGAGLPLDHAEHLAAALAAIENAQRGCAACGEPDAAHPLDLDTAEDWQPHHRYVAPQA